jgi:hypothetical protein
MLRKHTSQPTRSLSLAEARFTFGGVQPKEDKKMTSTSKPAIVFAMAFGPTDRA